MPMAPRLHRKKGENSYADRERVRKQHIDATRGTAAKRGYGAKWQRYREAYLAQHPLCERCQANGRLVAATVINHRRDHRGDMRLFWDAANHEALCKSCHDAHTARTVLNAASN